MLSRSFQRSARNALTQKNQCFLFNGLLDWTEVAAVANGLQYNQASQTDADTERVVLLDAKYSDSAKSLRTAFAKYFSDSTRLGFTSQGQHEVLIAVRC